MSVNYAVLVVEPDPQLRELLSQRLLRRGYTVTAVSHPRQALAVATFKDFSVALLGADLPEIDALTLIDRLGRLMGHLRPIVLADAVVNFDWPAHVAVVDRLLATELLEQAILAAMNSTRAGISPPVTTAPVLAN